MKPSRVGQYGAVAAAFGWLLVELRLGIPEDVALAVAASIGLLGWVAFAVAASKPRRDAFAVSVDKLEPGLPRQPKGMHCPLCKERGPDLTVDGQDLTSLPSGATLVLVFTCGNCERRWRWQASPEPGGTVAYKPAGRVA